MGILFHGLWNNLEYNLGSFYPNICQINNRLGPFFQDAQLKNQPTAIFPSAPSMSPWCDSSKSVLEDPLKAMSGGGVFWTVRNLIGNTPRGRHVFKQVVTMYKIENTWFLYWMTPTRLKHMKKIYQLNSFTILIFTLGEVAPMFVWLSRGHSLLFRFMGDVCYVIMATS